MSQATAGEEEDSEDEGGEDADINIEKEKAYLMHATSGTGMHAIEVRHSKIGAMCSPSLTHVSIRARCLTHAPWLGAAACLPGRTRTWSLRLNSLSRQWA